MVKPFGKVVRRRTGLTRPLLLALLLAGAALPAWGICLLPAKAFPTLASAPFRGPCTLLLGTFFTWALARRLKRRPVPRAPGEGRTGRLILQTLGSAALSFPVAALCAPLYAPALTLANGLVTTGTSVEHALVTRTPRGFAASSPFWADDAAWTLSKPERLPEGLAAGSYARLNVGRGLLGVRWVRSVDLTVLK